MTPDRLLSCVPEEIHDTAWVKEVILCLRSLSAEDSSVAQDDLAEILRAVGLGDHARPYSPHEVVQRELLPRLRYMATTLKSYSPTEKT